MTALKNIPIKTKLVLFFLLITLLTLLLCCGAFIVNDLKVFREATVRNLTVLAETMGDGSVVSLVFGSPERAEKTLLSLNREYQVQFGALYDSQGNLFAEYKKQEDVKISPPSIDGEGYSISGGIHGGILEVLKNIVFDGNIIGKIQLHAHMSELEALKKKYAILVFFVFLITLTLSLLISFKLQKIISSPILSLAEKTRKVSEKVDYSVSAHYGGNDELGRLYTGFNEMLSQIKKRESELLAVRDNLEKRVEERTAELTKSTGELKKAKEEAEAAARFKEGLNKLSGNMQGVQDTKTLSNKVILYVVNYLKIPLGAFFALNGKNQFKRYADFGYPRKKNFPDSVTQGSGLIGQAASEGKPIILRDIPAYAKASFGFGEAAPGEIILFPLTYGSQTIGVLELGSFNAFTTGQLDWIEQAARSVSVVLRATLDNTDRKRNMEMLKDSEERLELIIDSAELGYWDVNLETRKTLINKHWAGMLGYAMDEIDDAHSLWKNSIHPDDRDRVLQKGEDYIKGKISKYEAEYRMFTKAREIKWVLSRGASVERNEQGIPLRMVGTVMDVTNRRKLKRS